jgi:3-phosphoshikimate 1-carboxyvinyltransferase
MGAQIKVKSQNSKVKGGEPSGDLLVKSSSLRGIIIKKEEIPSLIDEIPILMVAACIAGGRTVFEGVGELRVKETDRIRSMSENLKKMGAKIAVFKTDNLEKIIIQGIKQLKGARVRSFGDHRTAMSMIAAGLAAEDETTIDDISCIDKSFPNFLNILKTLLV